MPQSLAKVLIHAVFSTKNRADLIAPDIEDELYRYIHGILENKGSKLINAGGTSNHVHLLFSLGKPLGYATLIGEIKRSTSLWIKGKSRDFKDFYWQEGYGVFSVGYGVGKIVSEYIRNQKEHHRKHDFKDEFRGLLNNYDIEYDERYVWD
jgi:REP element-mobilizing transposase RayT